MDKKKVVPKKITHRCIVRTTGSFGLLNSNMEEIHYHRPTVALHTAFIEQRILRGDLRLLASKLPTSAEDKIFRECWEECKCDEELSVNAFCSLFGLKPNGDKLEQMEQHPPEGK